MLVSDATEAGAAGRDAGRDAALSIAETRDDADGDGENGTDEEAAEEEEEEEEEPPLRPVWGVEWR